VAKGPEAFRTISEAADELGAPQHVLRFWETKFSFIRPMKRAGGRRFYRPQDLVVLRGVQTLLHREGYTIKGVQKLYKDQGIKRIVAAGAPHDPAARLADRMETPASESSPPGLAPASDGAGGEGRARLHDILQELEAVKARLDKLI
jgi:DNA-binding transcriptional MerR regulator